MMKGWGREVGREKKKLCARRTGVGVGVIVTAESTAEAAAGVVVGAKGAPGAEAAAAERHCWGGERDDRLLSYHGREAADGMGSRRTRDDRL